MELGARCYLFDNADRVLLVKHAASQPWVLPGGHHEAGETIYQCLEREIEEELGLGISILGVQNEVTDHHVSPLPLPISIHVVQYEHRERGSVEKMEYLFFARTTGEVTDIQRDELYDYTRVDVDEFLEMEAGVETYAFVQEILDQNIDLLELL